MWDGDGLESYSFEDAKAREMHNKTRDFIIEKIKSNFERTYDLPSI